MLRSAARRHRTWRLGPLGSVRHPAWALSPTNRRLGRRIGPTRGCSSLPALILVVHCDPTAEREDRAVHNAQPGNPNSKDQSEGEEQKGEGKTGEEDVAASKPEQPPPGTTSTAEEPSRKSYPELRRPAVPSSLHPRRAEAEHARSTQPRSCAAKTPLTASPR